jgi:hypothetical protein
MKLTPEMIQQFKKWGFIVACAAVVVGGGVFAYSRWYNATHLRVAKTRPDNHKVAATMTNIIFWYNRPLAPDTAKNFSMSPSVKGDLYVKGTALIFTPTDPLDNERTYTATISHATSADGKFSRGESKITFKTGFVPVDKQPPDVYQRGLKRTDSKPTTVSMTEDVNDLLDQGVNSDQMNHLADIVDGYFQKIPNKKIYAAPVTNVQSAPYDPNTENPVFEYTFDISINNVPYHAKIDCSGESAIELFLFDQNNKQVFDSGKVGN